MHKRDFYMILMSNINLEFLLNYINFEIINIFKIASNKVIYL